VDEQGLRQPGDADDQAVATDEQRQQHLVDRVRLPDDQFPKLGDDLISPHLHPFGERHVIR
jgi:hypothetical protein